MGLRFWRKTDNFKLDPNRAVLIDGHAYVITGFSSSGPYSKAPSITVQFEPLNSFLSTRRADQ
jgi:hypothetical protein